MKTKSCVLYFNKQGVCCGVNDESSPNFVYKTICHMPEKVDETSLLSIGMQALIGSDVFVLTGGRHTTFEDYQKRKHMSESSDVY